MGRDARVLRVTGRGQRRELDGDRMKIHTQGDGGGQTCVGQTIVDTELWTTHGPHTLHRQSYTFIGV